MANPIDLATLFREQIGGRRNLIINGAMQVAQRGTSETGLTSSGYYALDRFVTTLINLGTWTQTQETDAPDGFASSLKLECTTADASPAAGDAMLIGQKIEGQNLQHLKKGTSSAEPVTASFWVKSNKTGTYIFELLDQDNSARHIGKSFTVNSSGTWEYKTITFEGDTTGAFDNDNTTGLQISIWLGGGSNYTGGSALQTSWGVTDNPNRAVGNVNLADTIGNYIQLTGLQLELGETATPFEHRSFAEELALCKRYYQRWGGYTLYERLGRVWAESTTSAEVSFDLNPQMRVIPTALETTGNTSQYFLNMGIGLAQNPGSMTLDNRTSRDWGLLTATGTGLTQGETGMLTATNNTDAFIAFYAEL